MNNYSGIYLKIFRSTFNERIHKFLFYLEEYKLCDIITININWFHLDSAPTADIGLFKITVDNKEYTGAEVIFFLDGKILIRCTDIVQDIYHINSVIFDNIGSQEVIQKIMEHLTYIKAKLKELKLYGL